MTEAVIPLVGSPDLRNQNAYDTISRGQRFIGCVFDVVKNPVTGSGKVYVSKRGGMATAVTPAAGSVGRAISDDGTVSVFGANGDVYYSTTSCGSIEATGTIYPQINTGIIGGESVYLFTTTAEAWFLPIGALSGGSTFTANRTSGNVTLAAVSSFTGLYVGQLLTGTGIATGARIASMNTGASTLDMTIAATSGAATSTTVTRERVAKIIDADFPTSLQGAMIEIDGYVFICGNSRVYNSDQNSVTSWGASNYLTLNSNSGLPTAIEKYKGRLVAFGNDGFEIFYNAGNASGSPFSRTGDSSSVGCGYYPSGAILGSRFSAQRNDKIAWINATGSVFLMSDGVSEITTPSTKKIFANALFNLTMCHFQGRDCVLVMRRNLTPFSFLYDIQLGLWFESGFSDGVLLFAQSVTTGGGSSGGIDLNGTSGKVYQFSATSPVYQDDGASYTMTIQTARIDFGSGNRTSIQMVELDSDIQASGTATLEISDDDAQTWTTIGTFDMTQDHPRIYRCGSYKGGINFRITHSANTAFRASTLRVVYSKGSI